MGEEPRGRSRSPRVGDSPRGSPRGGRSPTREATPAPRLAPVPSWRGLRARLPRGSEPRAGELEAEPVAAGFGAHAHVLLSPRMMTNAGLGPGDWVALAVRGDADDVGGESERAPDAPPSAAEEVCLLSSALLARNLPGLVVSEHAHARETARDDERTRLGRHVVLARVHPHTAASSPAAIALARKTWMSLGRPSGGAKCWVCPLDVAKRADAAPNDGDDEKHDPTRDPEARAPDAADDDRGPSLAAPSPGASCASATLALWALEGGAAAGSAGDWLERGLRSRSGGSNKQLAVLESLARRALDGRCLLPGNLVRLPLLGASAYFRVDDAAPGPVGTATAVALRPTNACVKRRMVGSDVCAVCGLRDARGSDGRKRAWCEVEKHKERISLPKNKLT